MKFGDGQAIIKSSYATVILAKNPYRAILRREYPEPLIALLAFIVGIWLWDHYFGKFEGYSPGTEQVAMLKIDRDLRLADTMVAEPKWFRWLLAVDDPALVQQNALEVFHKLAQEKAITDKGLEAFAILKAVQDGVPVDESVNAFLQGKVVSNFEQVSHELANHRGNWWQARLAEAWQQGVEPAVDWRPSFAADNARLKNRTIWARGAVWGLGLLGLICLPAAMVSLKKAFQAKPRGYSRAWPLSMGLIIFLVTTLAWIGFTMLLELGIDAAESLPPIMSILLDSAARLLPPLIAIGLIFKRPSHAWRVLGLNQRIVIRPILGFFSILLILDQGLRILFGQMTANVPGGGLSMGDSGGWGLAFSVISACLLAPLAEEIIYRGLLFKSLWNRLGMLPAALLSAIVFALVHFYDGYGLASVGIFGLTCALLYASSGSLITVIAFHLLYNAAIKLPEWIVYHAPLG